MTRLYKKKNEAIPKNKKNLKNLGGIVQVHVVIVILETKLDMTFHNNSKCAFLLCGPSIMVKLS